ncbi:AAA family ATPase [Kitasatospora sp. NBC_01287]|uniref:helix-turn-helix transcriptional regulator n=1 Tax=Kitasatospora sp. NBC_01287 TaxID=2903573 RepID=UPI00225A369B|nr:LuxR family transcriptional regulator [Kitasatospora sp. NBC_01287]MCX4750340.1 AAA family ATPase [Kitasatospora sp. NBC_01287]
MPAVLVQRESKLAQLESALDSCVDGNAGLVLIEGAVGCGKSELLEVVSTRATERGHLVLRAIGTAAERALPLGVIGQLTAGAPRGALPDPAQAAQPGGVEAMHAFARAVGRLSAQAPVVICVDDSHQLDELSGRYLLHLARHTRAMPVLLVLAESLHERGDDPLFGTELLRQPNFNRVRLERLDHAAVSQLLIGYGQAEADRFYRASGGNPLLLRALLQDPGTEAGGPYSQAVLASFYRCGTSTLELAEGLAVLDGACEPDQIGELLGTSTAAVCQGIGALRAAGLVDGLRLRHPAARAAVLDRMEPALRQQLHLRAARLARRHDLSVLVVAEQLLAARHSEEEWALPVLRAAADQFLADGEPARATACLELAHQADAEPAQRTALRIRLAEVAWPLDPAAAERQLAQPLAALREDRLPATQLGPLARLLVAQGRIQEAAEALGRLGAESADAAQAGPGRGAGGREERRADPLDGLSAFPNWAATRASSPAEPGAARRPVPRCDPAALWALPEHGDEAAIAQSAELFLRGASLTEGTVEPVLQALRTLLHLGGPQQAVPLCAAFAEQAERRGAPGWRAALAGLQAEGQLRMGDLSGAVATAGSVLAAMPQWSESMLLSGIAGTLIRAQTAIGRPEEAAAVLSRLVPEDLGGSVHGLGRLRARGRYFLLTSRFHAALGDFLDVGRQLKRWGLDRPRVLPWRTDAAEALLRLGETHQAERFIADQLAGCDGKDPWVRGISLRVRAQTREPKERHALLGKAIEELHKSGDRYELALALADFGQALKETGDPGRAAMVNRRAWHLAQLCGAEALRERILPGHAEEPAAPVEPPPAAQPDLLASLSDSERRVAVLAVHGHTNREIAVKLYITVSTVEQHLTRVYRKLNIAGRQALPMDLQLGLPEAVQPAR